MAYQVAEVFAALTDAGWTYDASTGPVRVWTRADTPVLLTMETGDEVRIFWAIDRWPLDRIAAGRLPRF
jgi:hypothetical protein